MTGQTAVSTSSSHTPAESVCLRVGVSNATPIFFIDPGDIRQSDYLKDFAHRLRGQHPFYAIRAPGNAREIPATGRGCSITHIALRVVVGIQAIRPEGPYIIAGWCAGSVVAAEVAKQLVGLRQEVLKLIAIDPIDDVEIDPNSPRFPVAFFKDALLRRNVNDFDRVSDIANRSPSEGALERFDEMGTLLRQEVDPSLDLESLRAIFLKFQQALIISMNQLVEHYPIRPSVPTLCLRGTKSEMNFGGRLGFSSDPLLTVQSVESDHYSLFFPPVVHGLAEMVSAFIEKR